MVDFINATASSTTGTATYENVKRIVWPTWSFASISESMVNFTTSVSFAETAVRAWTNWADANFTFTGATTATTRADIAWPHWITAAPAVVRMPRQVLDVGPNGYDLGVPATLKKDELKRTRARRRILANAMTLLDSILSPAQRLEMKRYDSVTVIGSNGGVFRVVRDWHGMLWQLDPVTMNPTQKLCISPSSDFPSGDRMATLILWLQADEAAVLKGANRHPSTERELQRAATRRRYGGWQAVGREEAA